ncbi:MAG: hypothetical protein KC708_26065, partial [Anaerolineae bacterium]|nr:hypothetical protein [Anaerolineae bacterium]
IANIGAKLYVRGDLTSNYWMMSKASRACPKPTQAPREFGGRDDVLAYLKQKLTEGELTAITAVRGLGGVGKTTLARKLAHDLFEEKVFRAVLWADVTREPDAVKILGDWIRAYADSAFDATGITNPAEVARKASSELEKVINEECEDCEPPRILMVLDDVWRNGLEAARLILTEACPPNTTVLVTSRSSEVADELNAEEESLDTMKPADAAGMLQQYLPGADFEACQHLGEALGGHALALKLAVQRVRRVNRRVRDMTRALGMVTAEYRSGLADGTSFSQLHLAEDETRERNLELALSYSYDDLDETDQRRFRALGVLPFDEPVDVGLLAQLWNVESEEATTHCDTLCDASLLELAEQKGWYQQHPLLRAYASALLQKEDETRDVFNRYADAIIAFANSFNQLPPEQWAPLEPWLAHVHYTGDELAKQSPAGDEEQQTRCLNFALNVRNYVHRRPQVITVEEGPHMRGLNWLEMGLNIARTADQTRHHSLFLNEMALVYASLGEKQQALSYYEQALPLSRQVGDRRGE